MAKSHPVAQAGMVFMLHEYKNTDMHSIALTPPQASAGPQSMYNLDHSDQEKTNWSSVAVWLRHWDTMSGFGSVRGSLGLSGQLRCGFLLPNYAQGHPSHHPPHSSVWCLPTTPLYELSVSLHLPRSPRSPRISVS